MKRILVVDDDENLREILAAALGERSRIVDTARDGMEAMAPRVIFMTGHAAGGAYADFLKSTTEPFLEKPFKVDVGRNLVNVLLRG